MNINELFKKKKLDMDSEIGDHRHVLVSRAKKLIEELVSPLSEPNQQLIEELLTIISQTATMPANMVNKKEVLKTTKLLLFKIIKPIPNPNKKLIDELLLIISDPDKALALNKVSGVLIKQQEIERLQKVKAAVSVDKNDHSNSEQKQEAGAVKTEGSAQASAAPVQAQPAPKPAANDGPKNKTVMNLILQQIKELITITNNLNTKIKSYDPRIEAMEKQVSEIKDRNTEIDEKLKLFEKNIEKFIGLYEVVTNQFNPFIDTGEDYDGIDSEDTKKKNVKKEAEEMVASQMEALRQEKESAAQSSNPQSPVLAQDEKMPQPAAANKQAEENSDQSNNAILKLDEHEIKSLHDLEDALMKMSDEDFEANFIDMVAWLKDHHVAHYEKLKTLHERKPFLKELMKNN